MQGSKLMVSPLADYLKLSGILSPKTKEKGRAHVKCSLCWYSWKKYAYYDLY